MMASNWEFYMANPFKYKSAVQIYVTVVYLWLCMSGAQQKCFVTITESGSIQSRDIMIITFIIRYHHSSVTCSCGCLTNGWLWGIQAFHRLPPPSHLLWQPRSLKSCIVHSCWIQCYRVKGTMWVISYR